jgi:hypothetical protein
MEWLMKKCPFCAEKIRNEAIVCKHCGRDLVENKPAEENPAPAPNKVEPEVSEIKKHPPVRSKGQMALLISVLVLVGSCVISCIIFSIDLVVAWNRPDAISCVSVEVTSCQIDPYEVLFRGKFTNDCPASIHEVEIIPKLLTNVDIIRSESIVLEDIKSGESIAFESPIPRKDSEIVKCFMGINYVPVYEPTLLDKLLIWLT